jgi:transposase
MAVVDQSGFPTAIATESASPHEVTLVETTLDNSFGRALHENLIGDKAYDSDRLDALLFEERGVTMISPNKSNRQADQRQDGRQLRRYRNRWKVERFFAWLNNFRRIVVRWDKKAENFEGFVCLASISILLKYL